MGELGGTGVCVGLDEVGRGALAGPLTVAAVALPQQPRIEGLDDSKKLSPKRREQLAGQVAEVALGIGIAHIAPAEIDAAGMAASLRVAFARALRACEQDMAARGGPARADAVLLDGKPLHIREGELSVVGGDGRVACIAAASIVAKVTRDEAMCAYAEGHPDYGWEANKGYGTAAHIAAIRELGPSELHRRSFLGNIL